MKIGDRIKIRREQLQMSQEELAMRLGYKSRSSIAKIEADASRLPQIKIAAIASALETTPAYIMGWEEKHTQMEQRSDMLSRIVIKAQRDPQFFAAIEALYNMDDDRRNALMLLMK